MTSDQAIQLLTLMQTLDTHLCFLIGCVLVFISWIVIRDTFKWVVGLFVSSAY